MKNNLFSFPFLFSFQICSFGLWISLQFSEYEHNGNYSVLYSQPNNYFVTGKKHKPKMQYFYCLGCVRATMYKIFSSHDSGWLLVIGCVLLVQPLIINRFILFIVASFMIFDSVLLLTKHLFCQLMPLTFDAGCYIFTTIPALPAH